MVSGVRTSLARRIIGAHLVLTLAVLLGLGLYVAWLMRSAYLAQLEQQLGAEAAVTASEAGLGLAASPSADLQPLATRVGAASGARITLIAPDGVVLGDSAESPDQMENHADRPEVKAALGGERGVSVRHSATVGYDMLYVAVPILGDGRLLGVARAALPLAAVDRQIATLAGAVGLAIGVASLAAAALAVWLGRTTARPIKRLTELAGAMAAGQLDSRLQITSRDEVGELGQAFNQMADRVERTVQTISAERNRLAAILDTVAEGLVIVDRDGRVLLFNPGAERLLRVNARRAVGQRFVDVVRDHELAALLDQPNGGSGLVELDQPRRQVRALAAAITGADGQRLLLLQDVTELRRLETVRRDFAANVSHELRTPLSAMKAIVETLEDGALEDPAAARTFLSRLHDEVDELTELVRELLELSRIESGQAQMNPEPTDPEPLLRSAADRLAPLAGRAGVELKLAVRADLPPVLADPERVRQVLANLLHNAIKFTPPGRWVELRAERRAAELAISVADNGVGVRPDDLDRIFERFFKTDRSRSGGGSGLGLAIAKHLVQAHGGRIWAESGGMGGATFTFTLPLAQPTEWAAKPLETVWPRS